MAGKAYTLWLQWQDGKWTPTITAHGRAPRMTARQLLCKVRDDHYGNEWWKTHTRILPVGKIPR